PLAACRGKLCANDDRIADKIPISLDEQPTIRRAAQQPPLAHVANQLRVENLKVRGINRAQAPQLAATHVEHATSAVEVVSKIDGLLGNERCIGIAVTAVDLSAGLGPPHGVAAEHARELRPILATFLRRVANPEE